MKTLSRLAFLALALSLIALAPKQASAQSIFGGIVYGSDNADIGVKVGGWVPLTEQIDGGGNFTLFFPGNNLDLMEFNFDGRYLFPMDGSIAIHALAGLNITRVSVDVDLPDFLGGSQSASSSDLGINLGGVAVFGEGPLQFFGDIKIVLGDGSRIVFGGGASLKI